MIENEEVYMYGMAAITALLSARQIARTENLIEQCFIVREGFYTGGD
jgi:hypothetical protein